MTIVIPGQPVPKPRMTKSDKWKKRACTTRYWEYKDRVEAVMKDYPNLDINYSCVAFYLSMPKSWSIKKKKDMSGKLHKQKPDIDNLLKALFDSLMSEDKSVSILNGIAKYWCDEGEERTEIIFG